MIRSYFGMLGTWREAIETLRDDLLPLRKDSVRDLSTAGHRYVGAELVSWHRAREGWRAGAIEYLLGRDQYDYPFDTARLVDGYRYDDGVFWVNAV